MLRAALISYSILLSVMIGYGQLVQNDYVDSLKSIYEQASNDQVQVDMINEISSSYFIQSGMPPKDSARVYALLAIEKAQPIDYKEGLAEAYYNLGRYYIGGVNKPAEAMPHLLEGLDLFTQLNDEEGVAKCYMQLGLINYILQYYEAAVRNLLLSLESFDFSTSKYLLALTYTEMDSILMAKKYFEKSISDYRESENQERLNECYLWLGRLYLKTENQDSAYFYIHKTIDFAGQKGDSIPFIRSYGFLSEYYLNTDQIDSAIYYAKASLDLLESSLGLERDHISGIQDSKVLNEAFAMKGEYRKAYHYLSIYNSINENFMKGSIKQRVADMQSMFEYDQERKLQKLRQEKDKEIAQKQLAKEKILRNAFLVGSALLTLILLMLYSRFNQKKKANEALRELNEIISSEKKRSDDLLLNILPAEIAEELKSKGQADARDFEMVSILFTDFKEFTQISESLSAKDLVAEINHCFKKFDEIVEKYKIEKIKTIGDAYMAVGGLPIPTDDSVVNTVLAALEMQSFIMDRKREKDLLGEIAFEMRVGIHTGTVVAGIVGVKKFQYDLWGDTVNTASRIEFHGEIEKVNISHTTYELIKGDSRFVFESRGKVNAKGKGEVEMYFVELSQ